MYSHLTAFYSDFEIHDSKKNFCFLNDKICNAIPRVWEES